MFSISKKQRALEKEKGPHFYSRYGLLATIFRRGTEVKHEAN
jgi:hypothetical protein